MGAVEEEVDRRQGSLVVHTNPLECTSVAESPTFGNDGVGRNALN